MTIGNHLIGACLVLLSGHAWSAGFNDNGNGTVTDFATGLIWQQSDAHNSSTRTFDQAVTFCNDLNLAGSDQWRLPKIKELLSIVDFRRFDPAMDLTYFPNYDESPYWSASSFPTTDADVYVVIFVAGTVAADLEGSTNVVRCVR